MHVLIIGAGAAGTMAAWRLAAAGCQVTVLEQFTLDHDQGSSFGDSRIVRRVYADPLYTGLMGEAYDLWDELQASWRNSCPTGPNSDQAELICRFGGLFFGPADNQDLKAAEDALKLNGVPFEKLSAEQVQERFPEWQLPAGTVSLFEPSMGYARASNAVRAAAHQARRSGAQFIENTVVTQIERSQQGMSIITDNGERFTADRLLITAGAWTGKLLAKLDIEIRMQVTRQVYIHLDRIGDCFNPRTFPTWIDIGTNTYGFPQIGKSEGVKIASHNQGIASDPEAAARSVFEEDRKWLKDYAASHLVGLTDKVVYEKVCLYTNTPDEDFVIDNVPNLPGAYVISACSGHGFKFAPLIGEICAELAIGKAGDRDLSRFKLSRLCA